MVQALEGNARGIGRGGGIRTYVYEHPKQMLFVAAKGRVGSSKPDKFLARVKQMGVTLGVT